MSIEAKQIESCEEYRRSVEQATEAFVAALRLNQPIQPILDRLPYPAFVTTSDGQVLFGNELFAKKAGGDISPVGRKAEDYLASSLHEYAALSDRLVLLGAHAIELEYTATLHDGRIGRYITIKRSMLGHGHPRIAIFGSCHLIETIEQADDSKPSLYSSYQRFITLGERDQRIAKCVCMGESNRQIAEALEVSDKTIENRKSHILDSLGVSSPLELVKLMVRMQDNGFVDFGL